MQEEVLGELAFTHYYHILSKIIGIDFGVHWTDLNHCEQQAWIETAKTIVEVTEQLRGNAIKSFSATLLFFLEGLLDYYFAVEMCI
jgi:hypothetical protein